MSSSESGAIASLLGTGVARSDCGSLKLSFLGCAAGLGVMILLLVAELVRDGEGAFSVDVPFGVFFAKKPKIEGCVLFEALELCFLSTGGGRAGVESAVARPLAILISCFTGSYNLSTRKTAA